MNNSRACGGTGIFVLEGSGYKLVCGSGKNHEKKNEFLNWESPSKYFRYILEILGKIQIERALDWSEKNFRHWQWIGNGCKLVKNPEFYWNLTLWQKDLILPERHWVMTIDLAIDTVLNFGKLCDLKLWQLFLEFLYSNKLSENRFITVSQGRFC